MSNPRPNQSNPDLMRFGIFELDLDSKELRKNGRKVHIQEQPFRVLAALLERPGEIITREELREKLWPADTFVDFDHGVSVCVKKIRELLDDSATSPRFVETLPKRGYRFIAPVTRSGGEAAPEPRPRPDLIASNRRLERQRRLLLSAVATLVLVMAIAGVVVWNSWPGSEQQPPPRKYLLPGDQVPRPSQMSDAANMAISPNGRYVAYVPTKQDAGLWIRDLAATSPRELPGTEGALFPFWSPDSKEVAFSRGGDLCKASLDGPATKLCEIPGSGSAAGAWRDDGTIIFSTRSNLYAVESVGGSASPLFPEDRFPGAQKPQLLPSGAGRRAFLFWRGPAEIWVADLDTGKQGKLVSGSTAVYSPTGHILFQSYGAEFADTGIWALPFSVKTLKPSGEAFPVAQRAAFPSVARDGTLIYLGLVGDENKQQLVWRDRSGKKVGEIGRPQDEIFLPSLSPDGSYVAVEGGEKETGRNVWLHSVSRPIKIRLSQSPNRSSWPVWSPDGDEIAYYSFLDKGTCLFIQRAAPDAEPVPLLTSNEWRAPRSWSPDGKYLVSGPGLCYLKRENGVWSEEVSCTDDQSSSPQISPDGNFIAYVMNRRGRHEVYVRLFPPDRGTWELLIDRGWQPRWSRDRKELFYVQGDTLMSVPVTRKPEFTIGAAEALFSDPGLVWPYSVPTYDVSLDGQRFVTIETLGDIEQRIHVVQNWHEEFREE